jgi:hypothetical protein
MAETRERRRRRPQRPAVYLTLLTLGAVVALGGAWSAAHPGEREPAVLAR